MLLRKTVFINFLFYLPGILSSLVCKEGQFLCNNTLSNTILSINEWNYEGERCIASSMRCDGRHDCQDGLDELGCKFEDHDIPKHFWCFEGTENRMLPRDCLTREKMDPRRERDHTFMSSSVSETEEWVCAKLTHLNSSVTRQCEKTYTGGETFASCFWNSLEGSKCVCTQQLCNKSGSHQTETLLIVWFIVILFTWFIRYI